MTGAMTLRLCGGLNKKVVLLQTTFSSYQLRLEPKLTVVVLPLVFRRNLFYRVPMFCDLAVFYTEQVIERGRLTTKGAFTYYQNKITFTQHLMNCVVFHSDTSCGHRLQSFP